MWVLILAAAVQAVPSGMQSNSTAPPPIVAVPSPPRLPMTLRSPVRPLPQRPVIIVRVRAYAGAQQLFDTELRSGPMPASFSQNRIEAPPASCADARTGWPNNFYFTIMPSYGRAEDEYRIMLRWTRPGEGCVGAQRTVSLEQPVTLRPGRTVSVSGDAGLRVDLTRQ